MSDATITYLVLGGAVALFAINRLPVEIVALGVALALYATGVHDDRTALAGFGDPTVIFIASLFVVSEGLDATGVTAWAGQALAAGARGSTRRLTVLTLLLVAVLSAFITPNGAVAALVPVVVVTALRVGGSPASLLMPLAFSASGGALLALTGSPVNILASEAADDAGVGAFGFFSFALVGVPLVAGTIAVVLLLGPRVLPRRPARALAPDLSDHARTLASHYDVEAGALITQRDGVGEVVVPPRSALIGERVFPGMTTSSGDLVLLAVQRRGEDLGPGEVTLGEGDAMLLQGEWAALDRRLEEDPEVLVVDAPALVRRRAVPLGPGAREAIAVLVGMVILLATGVVPAAIAGLVAACATVLLGVLSPQQAYRAVSWTTVVLIGAMIALSTAIADTGAGQSIGELIVDVVGDAGPRALLLGLFVITVVFGQLISNTATALIVFPIAVSAAADLGVAARPVLMCVAVAAAASLLTPIATPANLMVMEPGGYRFGDYWKLGLPLLLVYLVVATLLVPLIWPL